MPLPVPAVKCPNCGTVIDRGQFVARAPWTCPKCSAKLQFSHTQSGIEGWAGLVAAFAFCYLVGARGWVLLVAGFLMWLPIGFIVSYVLGWIVRPRLEQYHSTLEGDFTTLPLGDTDGASGLADRKE